MPNDLIEDQITFGSVEVIYLHPVDTIQERLLELRIQRQKQQDGIHESSLRACQSYG